MLFLPTIDILCILFGHFDIAFKKIKNCLNSIDGLRKPLKKSYYIFNSVRKYSVTKLLLSFVQLASTINYFDSHNLTFFAVGLSHGKNVCNN